MNNNIRIIDPTLSKLPLMQTVQDAAKLNVQHRTTFYVSAYLFQCWICKLSLDNAAQMAEQPDATKRSFQAGQAWRGFQELFGKAKDAEIPTIFGDLMQFGGCDDPIAEHVLRSAFPLSVEHELTGDFVGGRTPVRLMQKPKKVVALMRSSIMRLCDWLDAELHLRVWREWHLMPDCFDPDPQKRELAYLGINQRHFDKMSEQAQVRYLNHVVDAAVEQKNSPNWAAFRQAANNPPPAPRPWPTENLDAGTIKLWPLVKRYQWSAAQLLQVLQKVLQPADLTPAPDPVTLVRYCNNTLSVRWAHNRSKRSERSDQRPDGSESGDEGGSGLLSPAFSSKRGEGGPRGLTIALRLFCHGRPASPQQREGGRAIGDGSASFPV